MACFWPQHPCVGAQVLKLRPVLPMLIPASWSQHGLFLASTPLLGGPSPKVETSFANVDTSFLVSTWPVAGPNTPSSGAQAPMLRPILPLLIPVFWSQHGLFLVSTPLLRVQAPMLRPILPMLIPIFWSQHGLFLVSTPLLGGPRPNVETNFASVDTSFLVSS